jgi:hypothetical protein
MTLLNILAAASVAVAVPPPPPVASALVVPAHGLPPGVELLYWPSGGSRAVTTVAHAKDGSVHFVCNGSSTGHCDFVVYRTSCATGGGPCAVAQLNSFRLAVGGVRDDGALPSDFHYCAGIDHPRCTAGAH